MTKAQGPCRWKAQAAIIQYFPDNWDQVLTFDMRPRTSPTPEGGLMVAIWAAADPWGKIFVFELEVTLLGKC